MFIPITNWLQFLNVLINIRNFSENKTIDQFYTPHYHNHYTTLDWKGSMCLPPPSMHRSTQRDPEFITRINTCGVIFARISFSRITLSTVYNLLKVAPQKEVERCQVWGARRPRNWCSAIYLYAYSISLI